MKTLFYRNNLFVYLFYYVYFTFKVKLLCNNENIQFKDIDTLCNAIC